MTTVKKRELDPLIVYDTESVSRKPPINVIPEHECLFSREYSRELAAVVASGIRNALVLPGGALTRYGILGHQIFNISPGVVGFLKRQLAAVWGVVGIRRFKYVENGVWVTNAGSQNFFHWLFDVLQKLEALDQRCSREMIARRYTVLVPDGYDSDYMLETLSAFDFNYYFQSSGECILVSDLAFIPDVSPTGNYRKTLVQGMRSRLKCRFEITLPASRKSKRIYISRRSAKFRKILNEDEIVQVMLKHAFEIVDMDTIPFREQIAVMMGVEVVVSLHGAGLSHMLWMVEGGKVIEIRAEDDMHNNCYFSLASDLSLDYYYFLAQKSDAKKSTQRADFFVDVGTFDEQISRFLG